MPIYGYSIPGYKLLQYGCSVVGLLVLAACTLISLRRVRPRTPAPTVSLKFKLLAALGFCVTPALSAVYALATYPSIYTALGVTAKLSGVFFLVLCTVYCAGFQIAASGNAIHHEP